MLKEQSSDCQIEDPLANIFEEGMEEFSFYEKECSETYKTRGQKNKEKLAKMERDFNDAEMKKQRNAKRRNAERAKLHGIIEKLSQQQLKKFIIDRKVKRKEEKQKVRNAMQTGQVVMVDLVYEDRMNGKENKSLGKQIELIMKGIKHVDFPPSIHLCSFQGGIITQLEKMGYQYWPLTTHQDDIVTVGQKLGKKLIYLSPDAELPLQKIEEDTAYILGGLIDRTIIKYCSVIRARSLGIQTRKLPIRQFMRSRIVLNLDHVVLMLCKYKQCGDWKEAFDFAAPKRYKRDEYEKSEKNEQEKQSQDEEEEGSNRNEEKQEIQESSQSKAIEQTKK